MPSCTLTVPNRRYATVVSDPQWPLFPWHLNVGGLTRTNQFDYPLMSLADIAARLPASFSGWSR